MASGYTSGYGLQTNASGIYTSETYPACSTSVNKTVSLTIKSDLPLTGYVIDCVNAGTKYTIQGSASPPPSNTATSTVPIAKNENNITILMASILDNIKNILQQLQELLK